MKRVTNILITGATGLIGRRLVNELTAKGLIVHVLTTSEKKYIQQKNVVNFLWNPKTGFIDPNCLNDVRSIIHLAGASIAKRWTKAYKQEIIDSRVKTAGMLYDLVAKSEHKPIHFISASAIGIYPSDENRLYTENSTERDGSFLAEVTELWEAAADRFADFGMRICKLRTGLVLANEGGVFPQIYNPIKHGFGTWFGDGEQWQSWIHIDDMVKIYEDAEATYLEGTFNAVAPSPTTNRLLTERTAFFADKALWLPAIPRIAMKLVLGEMHTLLYDSQRVSASKLMHKRFYFKFVTLDEALKDLLQYKEPSRDILKM